MSAPYPFGIIHNNRGVLWSLVVKNLKGKYKNSYLGVAWHILSPAFMIFIYYVAFSGLYSSSIDNFWIYLCSGIFAFNYMNTNLVSGTSCIVSNASIIKKIPIPRELIAIAQVISSATIFVLGITIIMIMIILTGHEIQLLLLPLVVIAFLLMFLFTTGLVLLFSSIMVFVRDVQHIFSSISIGFFFITPNYFLLSNTTGLLNVVAHLNPFTYYVELFHDIIYWGVVPSLSLMCVALTLSCLFLLVGLVVFRYLDNFFVEYL